MIPAQDARNADLSNTDIPIRLGVATKPVSLLREGSDRDSAEKMERLCGGEPKRARILTMPGGNRVADKTADKNQNARSVRAPN
jgi:hypothetical protein